VYGAYLLILTLLPLTDGLGGWQIGFGLPGVASQLTKVEILRFLELVASSTLVGYMVAEHRGRVVESYQEALPRLLTIGTAAILVNEGIRGFHAGHGASAARGLVLLAATLYGGWLYYLQRRHVLQLLAEDPPTTL
ncbi:MAG: hypothetical protein ABIZ91_08370, partial [Gemmatimonadaceae bacterium]